MRVRRNKKGVPVRAESIEGRAQFKFTMNDALRRQMLEHREVVWADVCRDAIQRAVQKLEATPGSKNRVAKS